MDYVKFKSINDISKGKLAKTNRIYHIDDIKFKENMATISDCHFNSGCVKISDLVEQIISGGICVTNPSILSKWSGFSEEEKVSAKFLCDITKNIHYSGSYTKNMPYPMLVVDLDKLDSNVLKLEIATDYDCFRFNINSDELKECIKQGKKEFRKLDYADGPVYNLSQEDFKKMLCDLMVLGVLRTEKKDTLQYGRVRLVKYPEIGSNIGNCCYTVEFLDESNKIITLDAQCRITTDGTINDLNSILRGFVEKNLVSLVEKDVKKILSKTLNNPVAELFDYKVCNANSVIISLKPDKTLLDLLEVDGFTQGFKYFKVETDGYNGRITFIKDINNPSSYFTINWGNSTTMVADHYWIMRDTLIRCVKQKCLMLF